MPCRVPVILMVTEALIQGCIQRDERAEYALYKALYPMLMGICARYERNTQDAAATLNAGFLKILTGLNARPSGAPFEAWARRIVINTVIDRYRRERPRREHEQLVDDPPTEVAVANDYLKEVEAEELRRVIASLPPMSRNVFNLFAIDGYPHAEIAELLQISEGTSKWHVNHARTLLKRALAERGRETPPTPKHHEQPERVR